jgi:hypothetical protein
MTPNLQLTVISTLFCRWAGDVLGIRLSVAVQCTSHVKIRGNDVALLNSPNHMAFVNVIYRIDLIFTCDILTDILWVLLTIKLKTDQLFFHQNGDHLQQPAGKYHRNTFKTQF